MLVATPALLTPAALLVAGAMAGNELAVALVNAQLARLDDRTHARAARPLAAFFGRVMPFWYALTVVLSLALLVLDRAAGTAAWWLTAAAAVLFATSVVATLAALVPINTRIARWDVDRLPPDWREERRRWDARHRVRGAALRLGFALLAASAAAGGAA